MKLPEEAKAARIAIAIDCADAERMGGALPLFRAAEHTINIDHHMTNTAYADMNHTGVDIAAAGEHIYELALLLPTELSKDIATCLYTALVTDTGNFSYANTRPHTLIAAAELLARGADNNDINRRVYRSVPLHKQKLLGLAITKAEFLFGGKLGITEISLADMASCGALEEDTEGIIDHIRDVEGDEVAIFIRESAINTYKVSLRSKKYADVGAIAASMGGGGHRQASGYTAHGSLQEVREAVLEKAVLAIGENDTSK